MCAPVWCGHLSVCGACALDRQFSAVCQHFLRLALVGLSLTHSLAWLLLLFNTTRARMFCNPGSRPPLRLQALGRAHLTPLREHRGEETGDDVAPRR